MTPVPMKPIPDEVLRVFATGPWSGDSRKWYEVAGELEMGALVRELLALRAWARGACAWLECATTGETYGLPVANVPQTAAAGRALLPNPPEAP